MQLRILYQDDYLIAIDKPAGLQVHPPEGGVGPIQNALHLLKKQTGKWLYPIHRLDRATSGVLLFAFSSEVSGMMQAQFKEKRIRKTYVTMVRGWTKDFESILAPLKSEHHTDVVIEAHTDYETLYRFELPSPVGRYQTARYSLLRVTPHTGKFHQIRRHMKHLSHPIVGDTVYGDGRHNRLWRELTQTSVMFLKAHSLEFLHPKTDERVFLRSKWNGYWHKAFDQAGFCPT